MGFEAVSKPTQKVGSVQTVGHTVKIRIISV